MKILITDVTEMHQGNYCVAGWSKSKQMMIRPLPNGSNWTASLLEAHKILPEVTIEIHSNGAKAMGAFPHSTEDTPIDPQKILPVRRSFISWWGPDAPPSATTLVDAFAKKMISPSTWNGAHTGNYVPTGSQVGSLAAVRVPRSSFQFYERDYKGNKSLGAQLVDGNGTYSLPVPAKNVRELYKNSGVHGANGMLPKSGQLHVRVGLAREWSGQPGRCAVMVNGVYW